MANAKMDKYAQIIAGVGALNVGAVALGYNLIEMIPVIGGQIKIVSIAIGIAGVYTLGRLLKLIK